MIRAPFNFVPLSDKVFFPDWADQISQDIPFSDGLSGSIELKITAKTPIFVRNGHTKDDAENKNNEYKSFSKAPDGRYFIPATSIKGCIRNVLEIMSFSKMARIDNKRYGIRDLWLKKYIDYFQQGNIHCGWMSLNEKEEIITITDNGLPLRISYKALDSEWKTDFYTRCTDEKNFRNGKTITSSEMYKIAKGKELTNKFSYHRLSQDNGDNRLEAEFDTEGEEGTIVFTGQPGKRNEEEGKGKLYQFVFCSKEEKKHVMKLDDKRYADFCFIYNQSKESREWKYWESIMKNGGRVPVFFSVKDNELCHLGLSYLYKLPYLKRIKEYLYLDHNKHRADMSDCIFGYNDPKAENNIFSLKGRVLFSHAFSTKGSLLTDDKFKPYMGGPRPTYYPIYIKQDGINGGMQDEKGNGILFTTMLSQNAELKGWKRYPVHANAKEYFDEPEPGQEDNVNPFFPMSEGSEFECRICYHNLKPEELGALICAIELNGKGYHTIGFAKPFGYGTVKIEISQISEGIDLIKPKEKFKTLMEKNIPNYGKTIQLKELINMSCEQDTISPLEYMDLNEYSNYKKQQFTKDKYGEYLPYYSELIKFKPKPTPQKQVVEAKVTFWSGSIKKAQLLSGKDLTSKLLDIGNTKIKLKLDDKIMVEIVNKGGNVEKLLFKKKL